MLLYHGTCEAIAKLIMMRGIQPRAVHRNSNWAHTVESNPNAVYLTDTYALYFAAAHAKSTDERLAIIEVETERLDQDRLVPDEDALAAQNHDDIKASWSLLRRARWYRRRLEHYSGLHRESLAVLGTCAYLGTIPVSAITRVSYISVNAQTMPMIHRAVDAIIAPDNFRFVAQDHRMEIQWAFGDPLILTEGEKFRQAFLMETLKKRYPDGIPQTVMEAMPPMLTAIQGVGIEVIDLKQNGDEPRTDGEPTRRSLPVSCSSPTSPLNVAPHREGGHARHDRP